MKDTFDPEAELGRILIGDWATEYGERQGAFVIPSPLGSIDLRLIVSDGMGWDHVSVSCTNRCPEWEEMCYVKGLFWDGDECVIQYHPREQEYVNCHPFCLHLWKPQDVELPEPPKVMVGPSA